MKKRDNMLHLMMGSLSIICGLVVSFVEPSIVRSAAGLALGMFLPGYCLVRWVLGRRGRDWLEELVLGVAASAAIVIVVFFALGRCGVVASGRVLAFILALIGGIFSVAAIRRGSWADADCPDRNSSPYPVGGTGAQTPASTFSGSSPQRGEGRVRGKDTGDFRWGAVLATIGLVVLVVLASFYRFTYLGYSDFEDDETKVLLRVQKLLAGEHDVIYEHHKGPGEIYVTAASAALSGRINELETRLPFAAVSVFVVLSLYLTSRALFGPRAALFTGLAAAVNGYFVAFGRVIQYQGIIGILMVLCFYCLWRAGQCESRRLGERYLVIGAFLLAAALLTHYEVIISTPAFLVLLAVSLRRRAREIRPRLRVVVLAILGVIGMNASFYVPFRLNPHWATFWSYLWGIRMGGSFIHDNIEQFVLAGSLYTDLYYLIVVVATVLFLCFYQMRRAGTRWWLAALLGLCATAVLESISVRENIKFIHDIMRLSGALFFLATLLACRTIRAEVRILLLWASSYFLTYGFLVGMPGTHWYVVFPGLVLLFGAGASTIWEFAAKSRLLRIRTLRVAAALAGAVASVLLAYHPYMMFVCHSPEYGAASLRHRSRLYITPGRNRPRDLLLYGFPHRDGWRTLGYLFRTGVLAGTYYSNEELCKSQWYLGQAVSEGPFGVRFRVVASSRRRQFGNVKVDAKRKYLRQRCVLRHGGKSEIRVYEENAFELPLLELERDEFDARFRELCTTERLVAEYRRPERDRANSSIEGYWLGEFRERSDERTGAELRSADPEKLKRALTRIFPPDALSRATGIRAPDGKASKKVAYVFRAGTDSPGHLAYGPYRWFPKGNYIARFWLRGEPVGDPEAPAVELDVASGGGRKVLGSRPVRASELGSEYRGFDLPFAVEGSPRTLEFRCLCTGTATISLDRVEASVNLKETLRF